MLDAETPAVVPSGVPGLDEILMGGLPKSGIIFLGGEPGTGKTTMGLQFLDQGQRQGERAVFMTLSQSAHDLRRIAASHGISLDGIEVHEITALDLARSADERQSVLRTDAVELSSLMTRLHEIISGADGGRLVLDSLFELRLLAGTTLDYRRELLILRDLVLRSGATALFIDYVDELIGDRQLEALSNGALLLEMEVPAYGSNLRSITVSKMRGCEFIEGRHDLRIRQGGVEIFPRVVPHLSPEALTDENISCGIAELDHMLGGGLQPGTTCLVVGQSGTGKSTLATAYAHAAAKDGRPAAMFLFEERPEVFRGRSMDLGFEIARLEEAGQITLSHFDPAEVSPGEFCRTVVAEVEEGGASVVVIDSLSGYLGSIPNRENLVAQLHALLSYLSRRNVMTILTLTQKGLLSGDRSTIVDASYLADSAILLEYRKEGECLRRTITVVKKRHGDHEKAVRDFVIGGTSVEVGFSHRSSELKLSVV